MILFLLLIICIIGIYNIKFGYDANYISHNRTISVNGLFILIVFLSHARSYISIEGNAGQIYNLFFTLIGQMMVVPFLFYSGYGLMTQFLKYRKKYALNFVENRVIKIWMHFILAVSLYIILNIILNNSFTVKEIFYAFIGWESLGNSNWYIFDIIVLYLLFYVAMIFGILNKTNNIKSTVITIWVLTACFWVFLFFTKERFWYDTLFAFPCGVTFAFFKDHINKRLIIFKNWIICIVLTFVGFVLLYSIRNAVCISISSVLFALILVLITMRIKFDNAALRFFGTYLFEIYVLQRIPMIVISEKYVLDPVKFNIISFIITILLAIFFKKAIDCLDSFLFKSKKVQ